MHLNQLLEYIEKSEEQLIRKLSDFLKIPSISTDKNYAESCKDAAAWLVTELSSMGFEAKSHSTNGHPIVLATAGTASPHLLFYAHYDVQPTDPLDEWETPPFEPVIKDSKNGKIICARGASDDKGQLLTFLNACEALINVNGKLPCKITILIEGEEESGSPSLMPFILDKKQALEADHALICDTGMWDSQTPTISTTLRGMLAEEVILSCANKDLHSGMYGGPTINPIKELSKLIASLHDKNGKVRIKNFYKDVPKTPKELARNWDKLQFSSEKFLADVGLKTSVGESDFSTLEQLWIRPTCELNGIWGGYISEGFKTVIPSKASAKISFRLVGNQNPKEIRQEFRDYLTMQAHADCSLSFIAKDKGTKATNISIKSQIFKSADKALKDEWQVSPIYVGCGGSIPIVSILKDTLNLESLLVGFALDDDHIHSPNEKYNIESYTKGSKSWIRIIYELTK